MARSSSLDVAASSRLMIVVRLTADMAVVVRCLGCWRGGQEDRSEELRAGGQGRRSRSGSTPMSSTLARRRYALLLLSESILPTYSGCQSGRTRSLLSARLVLVAQGHCSSAHPPAALLRSNPFLFRETVPPNARHRGLTSSLILFVESRQSAGLSFLCLVSLVDRRGAQSADPSEPTDARMVGQSLDSGRSILFASDASSHTLIYSRLLSQVALATYSFSQRVATRVGQRD
jgi:hypothetical protein